MSRHEGRGLRYTGRGCGAFIHGVPARDLTAEEVECYGGMEFLLASGIYEAEEEIEAEGEKENGDGTEEDSDREGDESWN